MAAMVVVGCDGDGSDAPGAESSTSSAALPTVDDVLEEVVPIPDDLRRSGFKLTDDELTEKELPVDFPVEQLPTESPPDPCDPVSQERLAGVPEWSEGRAARVSLRRVPPLPSIHMTHRVWRYESPDQAREVLAAVGARVAACPPTIEWEGRIETFTLQGEQFPEVAEYRWDIVTGPVNERRQFGWSQRLNDVVMVELTTIGSDRALETRDVLSQVSGRVLNREVDYQRYGVDDEDA